MHCRPARYPATEIIAPHNIGKKCLVLDLDETLVHSGFFVSNAVFFKFDSSYDHFVCIMSSFCILFCFLFIYFFESLNVLMTLTSL